MLRTYASLAAISFGPVSAAAADLLVALLSTPMMLLALRQVVPTAPQAVCRAILLPAGATIIMTAALVGLCAALSPLLAAVTPAVEVVAGILAFTVAILVLAPASLRRRTLLWLNRCSAGRQAALSD